MTRSSKAKLSEVLSNKGAVAWTKRDITETATVGTYTLNRTLGNEGMAISADKQHVYFFPADVPGGKLVRYRIIDQ
ncbi:hypothetical protein POL68_05625 [Stigmatella sp. ncwal1]|uniref:Uncharacterized protein n=1 Tax=Stigmatella ashevillensis TaxID=2995309 RepID=A0ABT5D2Q4_9BACT|nr:hypothetical protein [Stigmatella ashevillena]MDC0707944.1 hypothetical protein [Stigmatella ashevillena]